MTLRAPRSIGPGAGDRQHRHPGGRLAQQLQHLPPRRPRHTLHLLHCWGDKVQRGLFRRSSPPSTARRRCRRPSGSGKRLIGGCWGLRPNRSRGLSPLVPSRSSEVPATQLHAPPAGYLQTGGSANQSRDTTKGRGLPGRRETHGLARLLSHG